MNLQDTQCILGHNSFSRQSHTIFDLVVFLHWLLSQNRFFCNQSKWRLFRYEMIFLAFSINLPKQNHHKQTFFFAAAAASTLPKTSHARNHEKKTPVLNKFRTKDEIKAALKMLLFFLCSMNVFLSKRRKNTKYW